MDFDIIDITLTGSNAQYDYSTVSDLDIHVIVDFGDGGCTELIRKYVDAVKVLWANKRDVTIKGFPVEMYIEDTKNPVPAAVYSLSKNEWIREPTHKFKDINPDKAVKAALIMADTLKQALPDVVKLGVALRNIYAARRSAIRSDGETSYINLGFKALRNAGILDAARAAINDEMNNSLSLKDALDELFNQSTPVV
jgi:hypothetical protein